MQIPSSRSKTAIVANEVLLIILCQGLIMTRFLDRIALQVVQCFDPSAPEDTGDIGCLGHLPD